MALQHFGVVGNPVNHSLSPLIHQHFAKATHIDLSYEKIKANEQSFIQTVTNFFVHGGEGLNITLPFKQNAFILAQEHTERCKKAGAANTLWMQENKLCADNTDGIGFIRDVGRYLDLKGKRVLILGAGGAARGIIHPLLTKNLAELVVANRSVIKAKELQQDFAQINCMRLDELNGAYDLVINATSASLTGELLHLPEECIAQRPLCYDLAYKVNAPTSFVTYAKNNGCIAVDGLGMLVEQAAEAFFIWHGVMPETAEIMSFLQSQQVGRSA